MAIPRKVAPSGFPTCLRWYCCPDPTGLPPSLSWIVVLSLNSWVIAMPIDANAREVRSQARKVRSTSRSEKRSWFVGRWCHTKSQMIPGNAALVVQFHTAILV